MPSICATLPRTLPVINNPEYEYYQNEILYPSNADEMNTEYFYDIDIETRTYYEKLWEEILLAD